MRDFETLALPAEPSVVAPDGTLGRILLKLPGGSFAHFTLPAGATSHAEYASQLPVQQPLLIVGTWPLGHCGAFVPVQVTVPPQLPFGSVPMSHVPMLHQP